MPGHPYADFADWFNGALDKARDPVDDHVYSDLELAERFSCSREKINKWRIGERAPKTLDDIARIAEVTHTEQAEVLEALGFKVGVASVAEDLLPDEKEILRAYRRVRRDPRARLTALAVVRAIPLDLPNE